MKNIFLIINCTLLAIGNCGAPLITRLYFIRGGKRIWFSSWLQSGGWPILLLPLLVSYTRRRCTTTQTELFLMNTKVFLSAIAVGVLSGLDNYMYAYGLSKLPVSTSSLIVATQLAFTAAFAFLLVKQKFTAYSVNAVVLLTAGAVVLGLRTSGDRPEGETEKEYVVGFVMMVLAAVLYGFVMVFVEWSYKKAKQGLSYTLVLEFQLVTTFLATVFCTIGMLINNDFQAIPREAKEYELGVTKYYLVVILSAILWQCAFLGIIGVVFYSSSFLTGIIITTSLPVTEMLAVLIYHEKFQAEKGISLFLSLWGFVSYFSGEIKHKEDGNDDNNNLNNNHRTDPETQ